MIRKLKILGATFVAALALSAVAASTALARSEGTITCTTHPCTITGEGALGDHTFTTEAGNVECKKHIETTLTEPTSEPTMTVITRDCRAFGFLSATANMNGCHFLLTTPRHIGTTHSNFTHEWTFTTHVVCPAGKVIEITAATCKVTVGPQTPEGHVIITSTTTPTPDDIDIQTTITAIAYTVIQDGFGCPFAGTGAKTGATSTSHNEITMRSISPASAGVKISTN
jgi:hypothetical protein